MSLRMASEEAPSRTRRTARTKPLEMWPPSPGCSLKKSERMPRRNACSTVNGGFPFSGSRQISTKLNELNSENRRGGLVPRSTRERGEAGASPSAPSLQKSTTMIRSFSQRSIFSKKKKQGKTISFLQ
ncbi:unnamed protein product [Spirodela intermedia]|uniref:Uncharacterized protein n=1 Tax=Spirodela intermedia TaxID=51605 RepID=A0A7I8JHF2_SPIIN|nr:unnamed protein product [Spirodela intermedia]CAA6669566.1 unnamed protein product [Spirodela intermedia]